MLQQMPKHCICIDVITFATRHLHNRSEWKVINLPKDTIINKFQVVMMLSSHPSPYLLSHHADQFAGLLWLSLLLLLLPSSTSVWVWVKGTHVQAVPFLGLCTLQTRRKLDWSFFSLHFCYILSGTFWQRRTVVCLNANIGQQKTHTNSIALIELGTVAVLSFSFFASASIENINAKN